jgi:hypothetical protein
MVAHNKPDDQRAGVSRFRKRPRRRSLPVVYVPTSPPSGRRVALAFAVAIIERFGGPASAAILWTGGAK